MSYILDALKSSDRERNRGKIPDLQSQPFSPPPPKEKKRFPYLWSALVVCLAAGGYWVATAMETPVEEATEAMTPETPPEKASLPQPETKQQQVPLAVAASDPPLRKDEWLLPAESLKGMEGISLQIEPPVDEVIPAARRLPSPKPAASDKVITPPEVASVTRPATELARPAAVTTPAVTAQEPDPYSGIPHMRQLAPQIQNQLPEMNFSVHIFARNPASRMVKVNGMRLKEGGQIDPDTKLLAITKDGVVLQYKAQKYWRGTR